MKNFVLPEKTQQDLIKFLANYPYRDVASVIVALSQLKEVEEEKK